MLKFPTKTVYDTEVLNDELVKYDWLHLHHEDFTGQYGRFYRNFHSRPWYQENVRQMEALADKNGFTKVSQLKLAVVKKIKEYVIGGGFMFAMCSATDTYDIALAAEGLDICAEVYDGDPCRPERSREIGFFYNLCFQRLSIGKRPLCL